MGFKQKQITLIVIIAVITVLGIVGYARFYPEYKRNARLMDEVAAVTEFNAVIAAYGKSIDSIESYELTPARWEYLEYREGPYNLSFKPVKHTWHAWSGTVKGTISDISLDEQTINEAHESLAERGFVTRLYSRPDVQSFLSTDVERVHGFKTDRGEKDENYAVPIDFFDSPKFTLRLLYRFNSSQDRTADVTIELNYACKTNKDCEE